MFKKLFHKFKAFVGLDYYYTSKLDEFLAEYDLKHPRLSASQRQEADKYARIYIQRDNPNYKPAKPTYWDKF